ncbi:hypothetical protein [Burkholderia cepacia]|uniref:hypothetical protein n=1 Tax=Burkholderia cepacia TaxID=292 RepID=UPI00158AF437|nr:hypothetical protein [Burkholderia cepacia]
MNWVKKILAPFTKSKAMAQITLDDDNGGKFTFDIVDLLFISYDSASDTIVVCLKGLQPKYLPKTDGNLNFLSQLLPRFMREMNELYKYLRPKFLRDNENKFDNGG